MKFKNWWLGLPGLLYDLGKSVGEKKNSKATAATAIKNEDTGLSKAQTVYNYNYLDDSNTGNTLFDSQKKTKRTLFGNEGVI